MRRAVGALVIAMLANTALAQTPPAPAADGGPWRRMLQTDLAFVRDTLQARDIYAFTPDPAAWRTIYEPATRLAEEQSRTVDSFAGYRAVLKQYMAAFQDPHLGVRFNLEPTTYQWPGFLAQYRGGRFVVAGSQSPDVADGAEISACDGKPIVEVAEALTAFEGVEHGLESSKASMARALFVDWKNPFWRRPTSCRIGGADVALAWRPISAEALAVAQAPFAQRRDTEISVTEFAPDSAWVRLPTFSPDKVQAPAFHALIDQAPGLRTRKVIVLDVRGNGGGPYNWWVALLHSLYGEDFAHHYVRDRLQIEPVFVIDPTPRLDPARPEGSPASPVDALNTPPDTDLDHAIVGWEEQTGPDGRKVRALKMVDRKLRTRPAGPPPPNPVQARVYVLTDYGCGSSCVAFLDDALAIPGVTQIGLEVHPDRLSGSPLPFALPSGNGSLGVPSMVRLNRTRGDLVQTAPAFRYGGDIGDTPAVQRWVRDSVLPKGR